jgi:hypothetical protein
MAVFYEELEGSPEIDLERRSTTARRVVRIAWDDFPAFLEELFPDPYLGYLGTASFPGLPWLKVTKVRMEPFQPAYPSGLNESINVYPSGARVTVSYATPGEDMGHQGGPKGDHSGPGGSHGSSGNQNSQDQTFVTSKTSVGGEFITWPSRSLRWLTPDNLLHGYGDVNVNPNSPEERQYKVYGDTQVGITVPSCEHSVSWHFVPWPPWTAIRQCVGKVNAFKFAGAPRGTLLFLGAEASQDITTHGVKAWTLEYKFSEKNANAQNPLRPQGWNYFLRPNGENAGTFQPIARTVPIRTLPDGSRGVPMTTLTAALPPGAVTVQVANGSIFPSSGQFRILLDPNLIIDNPANQWEECAVIAGQGGNAWTVLRGLEGDPQRFHAQFASVIQYPGRVYDLADFRFLFRPGIPL